MIWHTLLRIEVSVEALLSPIHLILASGGLLLSYLLALPAWHASADTATYQARPQTLRSFGTCPVLIASCRS